MALHTSISCILALLLVQFGNGFWYQGGRLSIPVVRVNVLQPLWLAMVPELKKTSIKRSLIKRKQSIVVPLQPPAMENQLNSTNDQQKRANDAAELCAICKSTPDPRTKLQLVTGFLSKTQTSGTFNDELLPVLVEFTNKSIYSFPDQDYILFLVVLQRSGLKQKIRSHRPLVNILIKYACRVYKRWDTDTSANFISLVIQLQGSYHYYYSNVQVMFMDLLEKHICSFDDRQLMSTVYFLSTYAAITWKDLSPMIQTAICDIIIGYHKQSDFDAKVANSFLYAFAKMGPTVTSDDLRSAILIIAAQIMRTTIEPNTVYQLRSSQLLCNTLTVLSLLGFSQDSSDSDGKVALSKELQLMITQSLLINFSKAKEKEASNIFDALGNLDYNWYKLDPKIQNTLLVSTIQQWEELPLIGLSMTLRGLSHMQTDWMDLPKTFRDFISDNTIRILTKNFYPAYEAVSLLALLRHLTEMKVKFIKLRPDLQAVLFTGIRQSIPHLTEINNFSGIINWLAYMDLPFLEIEQHIGEDLLVFAARLINQPVNVTFCGKNAEYFCKLIPILVKANAKWALLEPRWKEVLTRLLALDPQPSQFALTAALSTLSSLGMKWIDLPYGLRNYYQFHLAHASWLHRRSWSLIVSGLGMLDARWSELEVPVRQKIVQVLAQPSIPQPYNDPLKATEPAKNLGMMLWGLSQLHAHWEDFPKDAIQQQLLACGLSSVSPSEFRQLMNGVANVNAKWDDLSKDVKEMIEGHFEQKLSFYLNTDLAHTAYTLTLLTSDVPLEGLDQKSRGRKSKALLDMEQVRRIITLLCNQLKLRLQEDGTFDAESALQIQTFFEHISIFAWGRELVAGISSNDVPAQSKNVLFPIMAPEVKSNVKPSMLSIDIAKGMNEVFSQQEQQPSSYKLTLQYHQPGYVFRSSIAVLDTLTQQPIALIDVSIPECVLFTGKRVVMQKQLLKERISRHYYPNATFIRLSVEDIEKYGQLELGRRIAERICKGA